MLDERGAFSEARFSESLDEIAMDCWIGLIGVDIPLGCVPDGRREADELARKFVKPRQSSVFNAPLLDALERSSYKEANAYCKATDGFGLSSQSYALGEKILEADPLWRAEPERIFEIHPEVPFRAIAGRALQAPRKSWNGFGARLDLLQRVGIEVPGRLDEAGAEGASDDVLDAAAAAWSARRILDGCARSPPDPPERDRAGRAVAIWY